MLRLVKTSCLALFALLVGPEPEGWADTVWNASSLTDRAKWKSFGVENWALDDPIERALPSREAVRDENWRMPSNAGPVSRLKSLIAYAEAGSKGYDAVHVGARIKPPKPPTQMTFGEIRTWVKATPQQPHAIGRYQFIPATLASLIRRSNLPMDTVFSPRVQDHLADFLLHDAGISEFSKNQLSRAKFMDNLALIWAGLPKQNGKSAYHGYAGNRATITIAFYEKQMVQIFGK